MTRDGGYRLTDTQARVAFFPSPFLLVVSPDKLVQVFQHKIMMLASETE